MNFLARIMSHGFAIALVVLLGTGYIYRGELFPDLELPEFLKSESEPATAPIAGDQVATAPAAEIPAPAADAPIVIPPVIATPEAPAATPGDESPVADVPADPAAQDDAPAAETTPLATRQDVAADPTETGVAATADREPAVAVPTAGAAPAVEATTTQLPDMTPADDTTAVVTPQAPAAEPAETGTMVPPDPDLSTASGPATVEMKPTAAVPDELPSGGAAGTGMPAPAPASSEPLAGMAPQGIQPAPVQPWPQARDNLPPPVVEPAEVPRITAAPETAIPAPAAATESGETPYQLLAAAREAYWLNDYEQAEINYRRMTELEPDNPDGFGELGNMFFSQGKWEEAATAYFEAGSRLVKGGKIQEAKDLLNVIRGLDGTQADELERLISQATASESQ